MQTVKKVWRQWLNPVGENGFVAVNVNTERSYREADLTIADCSRTIKLDFDVYEDAAWNRRWRKLQLLKRALGHIEEYLLAVKPEKGAKKKGGK